MLSIVDQLGRGMAVSDGFEGCNFIRVVIVKELKTSRVSEEIRLVFVQLDVWDESRIANVPGEVLLQKLNPLFGQVAQLLSFIQPWKAGVDAVEVNHSREEHIRIFLLSEKTQDVVLHRHVLAPSAAMHLPLVFAMSDEHGVVHNNFMLSQVRLQQVSGECLFGLPFGK